MARTKKRGETKHKPLTMDEMLALRDRCTVFVNGHGAHTPQIALAEMSTLTGDELSADIYGNGGSVALLEDEVSKLLKKPAAVFMPSGTMIQQIALRIHSDRLSRKTVAFHPTCHLELHEDKAYARLHGLTGLLVGSSKQLITLGDLNEVHEPIATLLLELPQREIGGQLPAWDDLVAQTKWARERGAAVHMDGARLWECGPFYGKPLSAIAALFDTVYVSFYKGLGGTAGGMLLGEEDVIAEAREWRHRHGGTIYKLWPYAASALAGLRLRLPRMAGYTKHARKVASALSEVDGVVIKPDPPQTPMMHIYLRTTEQAFEAGIRRLATDQGLWMFGGWASTDVPGYLKTELYCGDATLAMTPKQVASAIREYLPG